MSTHSTITDRIQSVTAGVRNNKKKQRLAKTTKKVVHSKGATLPGYNYLGPGNSLFNEPAVNEADQVARIHDIEYQLARKPSDIRSADWRAIHDFAEAGGVGGRIGEVGIIDKFCVESVTGILYPTDIVTRTSKQNKGNILYANREKALSTAFKANAKKEGVSFSDFKRSEAAREIYAKYAKGGPEYAKLFTDTSNPQPGTSTDADTDAMDNFDWNEFAADYADLFGNSSTPTADHTAGGVPAAPMDT